MTLVLVEVERNLKNVVLIKSIMTKNKKALPFFIPSYLCRIRKGLSKK